MFQHEAGPPSPLCIFAHPDDEILAIGGLLQRLPTSDIILVTDGAPPWIHDPHGYATIRRNESAAALKEIGVQHRLHFLGFCDQQVARFSCEVVAMIQSFSKCATTFLTHAFEHGHPDHDAICIAVHIAARRSKQKVEIFECALYRAEAGQLVFPTQFDGHLLSSCERNRKEAALACFVSQREFIARFPTDREIYEKVNLRNATDMDDFLYRYPNDIPSEALPEHWQRMASLLEAATS